MKTNNTDNNLFWNKFKRTALKCGYYIDEQDRWYEIPTLREKYEENKYSENYEPKLDELIKCVHETLGI